MRNFIFGAALSTSLVLVLGGLAAAMLTLLPTTADAVPRIERRIAMSAVDASMDTVAA